MVTGSRFLNNNEYKTSIIRNFGIKFYSLIASFLIGSRVKDVNSGYRAMNRRTITPFILFCPDRHPAMETILGLGRKGFCIKEIPVVMKQRMYGKSVFSTKKLLFYPFRIIFTIIKIIKVTSR